MPRIWGGVSLSTLGLTVEPKVPALVRARFLWRFPNWGGSKGSSMGCQGVPWDPRDPLS
jgi:hypothetical protein